MEKKANELSDRFLIFGVTVYKVLRHLSANQYLRHIGMQVFRSATSIGANYEEARGAESRKDFIHKMQIAFKESRESMYWLRLTEKMGLVKSEEIRKIIEENRQLCEILAKSIITVKANSEQD